NFLKRIATFLKVCNMQDGLEPEKEADMPKFALELRSSWGKDLPDQPPTSLLGVYLIDDRGNCLELQRPHRISSTTIEYAMGFQSVWPIPIVLSTDRVLNGA